MEVPAFLQRLYTERDELTDKHQNLLKFLEKKQSFRHSATFKVCISEISVIMLNVGTFWQVIR